MGNNHLAAKRWAGCLVHDVEFVLVAYAGYYDLGWFGGEIALDCFEDEAGRLY